LMPWSLVRFLDLIQLENRYFVPGFTTPTAQAISRSGLCLPSKVSRKDCFPESFSDESNSAWTPSCRGLNDQAKGSLATFDSKLGSQITEPCGWISGGRFMVEAPWSQTRRAAS